MSVKTKRSVFNYGQLNNTSLLVKPSNHTRNHSCQRATFSGQITKGSFALILGTDEHL